MKELFRSSLARRRARISKDFTSLLCFSFLGILRCCCILFDALIFQFFPSSRGCRAFSSVFILFFHFVWGNYNELKRTSFHHFTTFPSFSFSFCARFPLFFDCLALFLFPPSSAMCHRSCCCLCLRGNEKSEKRWKNSEVFPFSSHTKSHDSSDFQTHQ